MRKQNLSHPFRFGGKLSRATGRVSFFTNIRYNGPRDIHQQHIQMSYCQHLYVKKNGNQKYTYC